MDFHKLRQTIANTLLLAKEKELNQILIHSNERSKNSGHSLTDAARLSYNAIMTQHQYAQPAKCQIFRVAVAEKLTTSPMASCKIKRFYACRQ